MDSTLSTLARLPAVRLTLAAPSTARSSSEPLLPPPTPTQTNQRSAVKAFTQSLLKELVATGIRVCEVAPGFVETNFSVTRFRGDEAAAKAVYKGFEPREHRRMEGADSQSSPRISPRRLSGVLCALPMSRLRSFVSLCVCPFSADDTVVMPSAQGAATIIHRKE